MPRLLGLVTADPVHVSLSLAQAPAHFASLGQNNPDGWGLGYIIGDTAAVCKRELPVRGELSGAEAGAEAESTIFVAHVRRSSRAPRAPGNTHPFAAGPWMFAHTGALYPLLEVQVRRLAGRAVPNEGHTDSEALFHLILANLERSASVPEAIRASLKPVVDDGQFSGLNFVLARPGELYAFRYAARSAAYYSLFWRCRGAGRPLDALSKDNHARVKSAQLAGTHSVIVCSEQIEAAGPGESWQALEMGDLLMVRAEPAGPRHETVRLL